jgi:hypothetical protein
LIPDNGSSVNFSSTVNQCDLWVPGCVNDGGNVSVGSIFWMLNIETNTFVDIDNWNTFDGAVHPGTTLASTQALVTSYIHTTGTPSWYSQECPTCPWPPYGPQNLWSTNSLGYTNIPSGWQFFQRGS